MRIYYDATPGKVVNLTLRGDERFTQTARVEVYFLCPELREVREIRGECAAKVGITSKFIMICRNEKDK